MTAPTDRDPSMDRSGSLSSRMETPGLEILYRDDWLVAVDKPAGLLVHRTALARGKDFALQRLRRRLRRRVYTIHRLDRPASGVLLFALTPDAGMRMSRLFEERAVDKRYLGLVRGHPPEEGVIDYPLSPAGGGPRREAITRYRTLARAELPVPVGRYATSRYALVEARPLTGRYHQIRRHFHHVFHPLIGDTTHGEGRHNCFFREAFGVHRLLLHAYALACVHPHTGETLRIRAHLDEQWRGLLIRLGWPNLLREFDGDAG